VLKGWKDGRTGDCRLGRADHLLHAEPSKLGV
jgi:hypothetical protein